MLKACFAFGVCLVVVFSAVALSETNKTATTPEKVEAKIVTKEHANPRVVLETNYGDILIELFEKEAPISVKNFLSYVKDGFYDNTIFHRVVKGFVIQAGGLTKDLERKPTKPPIKNEATNGLKNLRGTVSMARTSDINSATSHFFINLRDNTQLDHRGNTPSTYGYAVFGKVVEGMDVVDKIAKVKVVDRGGYKNVPEKPVIIKKARLVTQTKTKETKTKKVTAEKIKEE